MTSDKTLSLASAPNWRIFKDSRPLVLSGFEGQKLDTLPKRDTFKIKVGLPFFYILQRKKPRNFLLITDSESDIAISNKPMQSLMCSRKEIVILLRIYIQLYQLDIFIYKFFRDDW